MSEFFKRLYQALKPSEAASPGLAIMQRVLRTLQRPLSEAQLDVAAAKPLDLPFASEQTSNDERSAMLQLAAAALGQIEDPFQAARLACYCGTLVEEGAPATLLTPALLERAEQDQQLLCALLDQVRNDTRAIEPLRAREPRAYRAWLGARYLNLAIMTAFCRDLQGRIAARARPGFISNVNRIGTRASDGFYVQSLFACADRLRFALIHPAQARGFVVTGDAVRDHFHLRTLLEPALFAPGYLCDPELREAPSARLRYFYGFAWQNWPLALVSEAGFVSGWQSPSELMLTSGELSVLLVAPSFESRKSPTASSYILHDAHRPEVRLERELSRSEVDDLLLRCRAPAVA